MARGMGWGGCAVGTMLGLFLLSPAPAAFAAGGIDEHAADIIADLQDLRAPALFEHGGYDIGEADGGYVLTLRDVRFIPTRKSYAEAGAVVLRLMPEDRGYQVTGFHLPAEMPVREAGKDGYAGAVKLAEYGLAGHWAIAETSFLTLDIRLKGLELVEADGHARIAIDSGHSSFADTPGESGSWGQEGRIEIRGLSSNSEAELARIGEVTMRWSADDVNRDGVEEFTQLFTNLAEGADQFSGEASPADVARMRSLGSLFGAGHATLEVRDMQFGDAASDALTIARGRIEFGGTALDQELSDIGLRFQFDGIDVAIRGAAETDFENVVAPDSFDISLAIENLPGRALWDALLDGMAPAEMTPDEAALRLGLALQAAGTMLRIDSSRFTSSITDVFADGMIQGHSAAAFGAVIAVSIDVVGLDALSALAAGQNDAESGAGLRELVSWLDLYGKPGTAPGGAPSRRVDVVVDGSGQLTVNGRPLPLFGDPPSEMEN